MKKRFLATLLCLCMVVTLLPVVASAASDLSVTATKINSTYIKDVADDGTFPNGTAASANFNNGLATVDLNATGTLTVTAPLAKLKSFASSVEAQGSAKWIGLYIDTALVLTTDLTLDGSYVCANNDALEVTQMTAAEDLETATGFILWIKAEDTKYTAGSDITISAEGYNDYTLTVKVAEPPSTILSANKDFDIYVEATEDSGFDNVALGEALEASFGSVNVNVATSITINTTDLSNWYVYDRYDDKYWSSIDGDSDNGDAEENWLAAMSQETGGLITTADNIQRPYFSYTSPSADEVPDFSKYGKIAEIILPSIRAYYAANNSYTTLYDNGSGGYTTTAPADLNNSSALWYASSTEHNGYYFYFARANASQAFGSYFAYDTTSDITNNYESTLAKYSPYIGTQPPLSPYPRLADYYNDTTGFLNRVRWWDRHIYSGTDAAGNSFMTFVGYYTGELIDYLFYPTDISGVKEVTYTIDSENVRTHSLEEAGFMFNIGVKDGYITGYMLAYDYTSSTGYDLDLYKLKPGITPAALHGDNNYLKDIGTLIGTVNTGLTTYAKTDVKLNIDDTKITVSHRENGSTQEYVQMAEWTNLENTGATSGGYGFGPFIHYAGNDTQGHSCRDTSSYKYSNLAMSIQQSGESNSVLNGFKKIDYVQGATKVYVILTPDANVFNEATDAVYYELMAKEGVILMSNIDLSAVAAKYGVSFVKLNLTTETEVAAEIHAAATNAPEAPAATSTQAEVGTNFALYALGADAVTYKQVYAVNKLAGLDETIYIKDLSVNKPNPGSTEYKLLDPTGVEVSGVTFKQEDLPEGYAASFSVTYALSSGKYTVTMQHKDADGEACGSPSYAYFYLDTYFKVTLDANGGTISGTLSETLDVDYLVDGAPFGTLRTADRAGYEFGGWYLRDSNNLLTIKATNLNSASGSTSYNTVNNTVTLESKWICATPTASPAGGSVSTATSVTLNCTSPGAVIRYTINGAIPSTSSSIYDGPISLAGHEAGSNVTIKAVAFSEGGGSSSVMTAEFTIINTPTGDGNANNNVPVLVGGVSYNIGTQSTSGGVITVTPNQIDLNTLIENAAKGSEVIIPITTAESAHTGAAKLVLQNIDDLRAKGMSLVVRVDGVDLSLPAGAMDTDGIAEKLGAANRKDAPVIVSITRLTGSDLLSAQKAVQAAGLTPVGSAYRFEIAVQYGGRTIDVAKFARFTARTLPIPSGSGITTAIVINTDGTVRHLPTSGTTNKAIVRSLTNSTYILVKNEKSFADAETKWFKDIINEMGSRLIINGRSSDVFDGEAKITRAEFAAIIVRALGLPETGDASKFSDVASSAWYYGSVGKAAEYGIILGRGDGTFAPNEYITRQDAMLMIQRAAGISEYTDVTTGSTAKFTDLNTVSDYAKSGMYWNLSNGFIVGHNGLVRPQETISRAECATIVLRLLQKSGLVDVRTQT